MKKVSVIIPIYNGDERFLRTAIESAINQTYSNIEIIIIDDGSNNHIQKLLDEYDKNYDTVKVIHKENEGVSVARNMGIEMAMGDFIFFLDSDDYLTINTIERLLYIQEKYTSDITGCLYYIFNDKLKKSLYSGPNLQIYNDESFDCFRELMFAPTVKSNIKYPYCMCVWGKLFKRDIIIDNDIYFDRKLSLSEDLLFFNRISYCANKMVIISDELYGYRISEQSVTHRYDSKYNERILKMLSILEKEIDLSNDNLKKSFLIYKLLFLINIIKYYYANKRNDLNYFSKIKEIKEICEGFDLSNAKIYSNLPFKYRMFLYLLNYKLIDIAYFLAVLSLYVR